MGLFDEIRSKLPFGQRRQDYDQDGEYAEGYYDGEQGRSYEEDGYQDEAAGYGGDAAADLAPERSSDASRGVLGQTRRGEAESVAVYTRSGQLIGDAERHATTFNPPARFQDAARPGAYDTPSSYGAASRARAAAPRPSAVTSQRASSIINAIPQLPVFVLKPESYDDVETVVRRVRTKQPVALVFTGIRTEIAKRVLDFCYGFACGLGAAVQEVGDRVFIVVPAGCEIKSSDLSKLRSDGHLK